MPPSCGRSGSTRNGEGVQSVILGLVEDEDDFSIPITQSKQSTGKMFKTFVGPRRKAHPSRAALSFCSGHGPLKGKKQELH